MRTFLLSAAGSVLLLVGIVHSVLGEQLIFDRVRGGGPIPALGAPPLLARHIRILWASWHIVTVFGAAFAAALFHGAWSPASHALQATFEYATAAAMFAGALLVLVGTRGRHPGWGGLLAVAVLVLLARAQAG